MFSEAERMLPVVGERSTAYPKVRALAEQGLDKAAIKKAMGWGIGIPWTPYRGRLLKDVLSWTDK
jgi:hypothetical protein